MGEDGDSVTELLRRWQQGDAEAEATLLDRAYPELKKLAASHFRRSRGNSIDVTELVHEAYQKVAGKDVDWRSRSQFYAFLSTCMRRILIDHARARQRRGEPVTIADLHAQTEGRNIDLLALDAALDRLAGEHAFEARVVELKFFGGLTIAQSAELLEVGHATVERAWSLARAWLFRELSG